MNTVKAVAREVRDLKKTLLAQPEKKFIDYAHNFIAINNVPFVYHVSDIVQGTASNQRSGLKITPKSFSTMLRCQTESSLTGKVSNELRLIVFRWFDDVPPTASAILNSTAGGIFSGYEATHVPTLYQNKTQYQVLYDKNIQAVSDTTNEEVYFKFDYTFNKNAKILYQDSTAASNMWGQLYCMIVSDSVSIPHPQAQGYSRLVYTDS